MTPTQAALTSHYADIRARLMGKPERKRPPLKLIVNTSPPSNPGELAWEAIMRETCVKHGIDRSLVLSKQRKDEKICACLHEVMYRLRNEVQVDGKPISLTKIGMLLGNRDHATVVNGIMRHNKRLEGWIPHHPNPTLYEVNGETLTLMEWSKRSGISYKTLHKRVKRGWSTERIFDLKRIRK